MSEITPVYSDAQQLSSLVHNKHVSTEAKLKEVSVQFESIMMREYLKTAMSSMFKSQTGHAPAGSHFYEGMMVDKMADSLSRTGQVGIADTFMRELRMLIPKDELESAKPKQEKETTEESSDPMAAEEGDVYPGALGATDEQTIQNLYQVWSAKGVLKG